MNRIKIDPGFEATGYAVADDDKILEMGELHHRTNIADKMGTKKMYRCNRRSRKTPYRESRFDNRCRKDGWMPPTIKSRVFDVIKLIDNLSAKYIAGVVDLEVANFDISAMTSGVPSLPNWAYQKGPLYEYENVKMYVRARDNYTCQYCGEKYPDILEVDHVIPKSRGGTDRADNLVAACHKCNQKKGNMTAEEFGYPEVQRRVKKSLRAATITNILVAELIKRLSNRYVIEQHYGYTTKVNRELLGLPKTHYFDAACIGDIPEKYLSIPEQYTYYKRVSGCNRVLTVGQNTKRSVHLPYEVFGCRVNDTVKYNGEEYHINGRRFSGYMSLADINGTTIFGGVSYKNLVLAKKASSMLKAKLPAAVSAR